MDPSLTCSGWALFDLDGRALLGVGNIHALPPKIPLALRLSDLQQKISGVLEHLKLFEGDVLVCEAPTTMRDPRGAFLVEQVRGIFEILARVRGVTVPGRLNPRSVQYELLGLKGRQLARQSVKEAALCTAARLYGPSLARLGFDSGRDNLRRNQDIVDAILVGGLALTRIGSAAAAGVTLEEHFDEHTLHHRSGLRKLQKRASGRVLTAFTGGRAPRA